MCVHAIIIAFLIKRLMMSVLCTIDVFYGRTHKSGTAPPCPGIPNSGSTNQAGKHRPESIGRVILGKTVTKWPVHTANDASTIFSVDQRDPP